MIKNPLVMQETWVQSLGQEHPLEKEMATHSRILAWKIPWMEDPVILNGLPWKRTEIILSFFRLYPSTAFQTLLLTMVALPFLLRDS